MPKYFFNLHECGTTVKDVDGSERADLAAAHQHAVRAAKDVMCAEVQEGRLCLSCFIEVTDEAGTPVLRVLFKDVLKVSGL